jgi:folate-binding Fe-S cluster repair protein YgfZ
MGKLEAQTTSLHLLLKKVNRQYLVRYIKYYNVNNENSLIVCDKYIMIKIKTFFHYVLSFSPV